MTRIAPVTVCYNPRIYWFDALDFELSVEDKVVVDTALGSEIATVAKPVFEATESQISSLKSPLRAIVRLATPEDLERSEEMDRLGQEAMPVFREFAAETNADMRPVAVRYLLSGTKAIFYFEAEDRMDFRELVKRLASHFHVRVDMRQIGVRDEARMIGGLGHCGQELCCARMGGNFNPVSIRMAKEQDLSLNPQKISGTCGRLMCCLRYEYDVYKEVNARAPKRNATIATPEGPAKVVDMNVPRETVTLKLEDERGKTVKVLLSDFDPPEAKVPGEKPRPRSISQEAWDEVRERETVRESFEASFLTSQFTQEDKVGAAEAVHHERRKKRAGDEAQAGASSRSRGKKRTEASKEPAPDRKRRRRSTKISGAGEDAADGRGGEQRDAAARSADSPRAAVRPGQRSSGLRAHGTETSAGREAEGKQGGQGMKRSRRRGSSQGAQAATGDQGAQNGAAEKKKASQGGGAGQGSKRRGSGGSGGAGGKGPSQKGGQKGGQVQKDKAAKDRAAAQGGAQGSVREGSQDAGGAHRRSRRRSHVSGGASGAGNAGNAGAGAGAGNAGNAGAGASSADA